MCNRIKIILVLCLALWLWPTQILARAGNILFDAEVAALFKSYSDPLIRASGMPRQSINIFLQADEQINAYAAPGYIVLNSGLVLETETPEELEGIIAHEIAHIKGGHMTTLTKQRKKAGIVFLTSQILGLGAIIAGLGPLGALVLAGGTSIGAYSAIGETRIAEASADQAALTYLDRASISGRGLLSFFEREFVPFERAFASANRQALNPYLRTHPLSSERLTYLQERVVRAKHYHSKTPPDKQLAHDLARAKLYGFFKQPQATLEKYPMTDSSLVARYARTVMSAYHYAGNDNTLAQIDALIAERPKHPYFYELKGYVLSRSAKFEPALKAYEQAISLAPDNAIMRLEIGAVLVNSDDTRLIKKGLDHLRIAANQPGFEQLASRALARGFGALKQFGLAELATAQALMGEGKPQQAANHARRALKKLPKSDHVNRLRAQDILLAVSNKPRPRKSKRQ